jgi:(S)-2-hydroxyglutarate dehydrogenase
VDTADIIIIGGGIVGLATAYQTLRANPGLELVLLEKEQTLASHQTGHNSGVIHSGIYYKPGSLKAGNCRRGRTMLLDFCREQDVAFDLCSKVIVAVDEAEVPALERIYQRGQENGVACEIIDAAALRELEPNAAGISAIQVHDAGIISYRSVCIALGREIERMGGKIILGGGVRASRRTGSVRVVSTDAGRLASPLVVNCAGLQSDRIARLLGTEPGLRVVAFRGEYYELVPSARSLCRNLIYPVPDARFPFLGVHFTRMIDGSVECGPNAVLALGREAYDKTALDAADLMDTLGYPAFWKLSAKHWKMGAGEIHRSISKAAFVKALQRLMPAIRSEHLTPAPAGIRAQALLPGGALLDDFAIAEDNGVISVCNAPSPAATSSLSIGQTVAERITQRLVAI